MRLITGAFLCALFAISFLSAAGPAQAETGPFAVTPEACTIEPASMPQPGEEGNLATPAPTPTPIAATGGDPADETVMAAVSERIAQAIACQNAGDALRLLANFTERWVEERFSGYDLVFYGRFQDAAANPEPLPAVEQLELISIQNVLVVEDVRVVATVITRVQEAEQQSLVVLVQESGTWLIDGGALTGA